MINFVLLCLDGSSPAPHHPEPPRHPRPYLQPRGGPLPPRQQQQRQPCGLHQRGRGRLRRVGQAAVVPVGQGRDRTQALWEVSGRRQEQRQRGGALLLLRRWLAEVGAEGSDYQEPRDRKMFGHQELPR